MKLLNTLALAGAASLLTAASAMASPILIQHQLPGNDCSGYFGQGFDSCQIFVNEDGQDVKISPVIAKYDGNGNVEDVNDRYQDTFSGSEISMDLDKEEWNYTPGTGDPGIRYWAAKGGNNFNLFWYVDSANAAACDSDAGVFTLACLEQAMAVTEGSWTVPLDRGLSHLTFYNSEQPYITVPEPGTIALLGLGLFGLGIARRKSKAAA